MNNIDFFLALDALEKQKGISKAIFIETLEQALVFAYKKDFGSSADIKVHLNEEKASIRVYATKLVVEEVVDGENEISLEEAIEIKKSIKLGDYLTTEITPKNFGRIAAQTAKQVIMQRLGAIERDTIVAEFAEKENDIMTVIIRRKEQGTCYCDLGKGQTEGIILLSDQIRGERYNVNDKIKVYVKKVKAGNQGPQIMLSRTHPNFVRKLFEYEVPEIKQGIVEIMSIAREAGQRTKIAICSKDDSIDAVGACVGTKGVRVNAIVSELSGEKIDIINYSEDPLEYIARSLSPAEVTFVEGDEEAKIAKVAVADDKLSLAIGKEGQNARLAAKLTGWKIDVKAASKFEPSQETEMDILDGLDDIEGIDIEELKAEIEAEMEAEELAAAEAAAEASEEVIEEEAVEDAVEEAVEEIQEVTEIKEEIQE
ncbi:MAG: transcription termination factor NusA [Bacillota bacterium]